MKQSSYFRWIDKLTWLIAEDDAMLVETIWTRYGTRLNSSLTRLLSVTRVVMKKIFFFFFQKICRFPSSFLLFSCGNYSISIITNTTWKRAWWNLRNTIFVCTEKERRWVTIKIFKIQETLGWCITVSPIASLNSSQTPQAEGRLIVRENISYVIHFILFPQHERYLRAKKRYYMIDMKNLDECAD